MAQHFHTLKVARVRREDPRLGESFARADLLVYRAKADGRDRVVVEYTAPL